MSKEPGQLLYEHIDYDGVVNRPWNDLTEDQKSWWAVREAAIRADERAKATAIERERCAKVAESEPTKTHDPGLHQERIAAAIRAGEKPATPSRPGSSEGPEA